jgi:hypothetical protein
MIIIIAHAKLKRWVRSSGLLFSAIKGADATQDNVPIKPEAELAVRSILGSKTQICATLIRLAMNPIRMVRLGPIRAQSNPAGNAIQPVAIILAVDMMPMKSDWKFT